MLENGSKDFLNHLFGIEYCFKEQYGDKMNQSYILTEFNNIKRLLNEYVVEFNTRFQKRMYKLMQPMQDDDKVCLITYLNAFDGKILYQLRDKDPRTLREAFRMAINVENNLRITGRL